MIVHQEFLNLSTQPAVLLSWLRNQTIQPYKPHTLGYTHSHELQNLPDFRLMEGHIVPPHTDGVAGYRPILMLENPSNSYTIRGVVKGVPRDIPQRQIPTKAGQWQRIVPQRPGTLIVLDIDAPHEVYSKDPNGGFGPWSALVWGPAGCPCAKEAWNVERVREMAKEEFEQLVGVIKQ